jgi:lipopolysaccharide/colanic/teichoic acid biosynthesis glycosyltransferase
MPSRPGPSPLQAGVKRAVDVLVAAAGLLLTWPAILLAWVIATVETRRNGLYRQCRVGKDGELFEVLKIRTMRDAGDNTVTTRDDTRITRCGAVLRRLKVDELPQLLNVLRGDMSLVGPRPDVPGFADRLAGEDRLVLTVRPGITGPAAIAYRYEENILAEVDDPLTYNREVVWPDKVRINRAYVQNYSLTTDFRVLATTVRSVLAPGKGVAR